MSDRLTRFHPWLELILGLGLGLVLYLPLNRTDLGEVAWVVAAIVSVGRLGHAIDIRQRLAPMQQLVSALGLREESDGELRGLIHLHDKIAAPELQLVRDDILRKTSSALKPLAYDMTSEPLPPSSYYEWLSRMLTAAQKGDAIRAVSTMLESEWDDSPPEARFLRENIAAAKRGVDVERLFVVPEARVSEFRKREVARIHSQARLSRLRGIVVTVEALQLVDHDLLHRLGEGFIAFGMTAALIDVTVPPDQARGRVTVNLARIADLVRSFEQAKIHSTPLSEA